MTAASAPPPAPGAVPVLGHALQLWRRPLPFLRGLTGGAPVVGLRLGPVPAYLACSGAAVDQVLHEPRTFDKGGPLFEKARLLVGDGLVSSDFRTHRRQRRLVQPAFGPARLPGYAEAAAEETDAEVASWPTDRPLDVSRAMHTLTLRVAARTILGARLHDRAADEVVAAMPVLMRGVYQRMLVPAGWVHELPLPANRRFARARATMHRVIQDAVGAYRRSGRDHGDILSVLVGHDDGGALADDEIHDHVMTLLIGATEPPGDALTWVFHLLAGHPEVEREVHGEVDAVLAGGPAGPEHLPALGHVRRTLLEALRLYPPAWLLTRVATGDAELAGHPVPAGATVLFSPYQRQHDPDVFTDPLRFDPDRWRVPTPAARSAMLPFGAGNRKCIGDEVALTQLTLTIATVASRFRMCPVPGTVVRPLARASLGAGGVLLTPRPRRSRDPRARAAGPVAS